MTSKFPVLFLLAARLAWLSGLLLLVLWGLEMAVLLFAKGIEANGFVTHLIVRASLPIYAASLFFLGNTLRNMNSAGKPTRALEVTSGLLILGTLLELFLSPQILFWLSEGEKGALAHFIPSAVVLFFAGAGLGVFSSALRKNVALQRELDEFV